MNETNRYLRLLELLYLRLQEQGRTEQEITEEINDIKELFLYLERHQISLDKVSNTDIANCFKQKQQDNQ